MCKDHIKAFCSGLAVPATIMSVVYTSAFLLRFPPFFEYPLQFLPIWIPLLFGLWNVFNVHVGKGFPVKEKRLRYWTLGILLGFFVAIFGIVVVKLPVILFGLTGMYQLLPLLIVPVVYGLLWRYLIMPLNKIMGLK